MKSCERYELLASLVLDGEAGEAEQAELEAHLEACPDCRAYFEDIRRIHAACAREEISVPEGFAVRVMDRVRETKQDQSEPEKMKKKVIQFAHWKRWTALAACCAVVVLSLWAVRGTGGVKGDIAAVDDAPQAAVDMRSTPESTADRDGPAPLLDDKPVIEGDVTLDEAPPEIPDEYQDLAKSAVKDGAAEGQYQPQANSTASASQEPAMAAAPPAGYVRDEAQDVLPEPVVSGLDREEAAEEDGVESVQPPEPEESVEALAPEETEPLEEEPGEETPEPEEPADGVEPVEVIGVPEPGILTAYGPAAQEWVENVLGLEWAAGGSYPLTAEQYGDLILTLDGAGEFYGITPGEGYCLMTE